MKPAKSMINVAMRKMRFICLAPLLLPGSSELAVSTGFALDFSVLTNSVEAARADRYEAFRDFRIKGVCGTARLDLAAAYGANTLRTYTPPSREQLDKYQRLGLKVIVGIWMPNQGENSGKNGTKWNFDYREQGDAQIKDFEETVNRIGDHPAILMWGLGNEVHLDPPYLRDGQPHVADAAPEASQALEQHHDYQCAQRKDRIDQAACPGLGCDWLQQLRPWRGGRSQPDARTRSGGAPTTSRNSARKGPWWGRKTAWGEVYEQSYDAKLDDLRKSFREDRCRSAVSGIHHVSLGLLDPAETHLLQRLPKSSRHRREDR